MNLTERLPTKLRKVACYTESCARHLLASCNIAYNTPNMAANKNTSMKETMRGSPPFGFLYTPPR